MSLWCISVTAFILIKHIVGEWCLRFPLFSQIFLACGLNLITFTLWKIVKLQEFRFRFFMDHTKRRDITAKQVPSTLSCKRKKERKKGRRKKERKRERKKERKKKKKKKEKNERKKEKQINKKEWKKNITKEKQINCKGLKYVDYENVFLLLYLNSSFFWIFATPFLKKRWMGLQIWCFIIYCVLPWFQWTNIKI